jgi:hypothetical protein
MPIPAESKSLWHPDQGSPANENHVVGHRACDAAPVVLNTEQEQLFASEEGHRGYACAVHCLALGRLGLLTMHPHAQPHRYTLVTNSRVTGVIMPEPGRDGLPWAKKKPTVALFPLDDQSKEIVSACFSNFSIDVVSADDSTILHKEKLEGCVVSLTSSAVENIVAEARN